MKLYFYRLPRRKNEQRERERDSHNEGAGPKEGGQTDEGTAWGKAGGWRWLGAGTGRCEGDIHHPPTPRLQMQTGSRNQVTGGAAGLD